MGSVKQTQYNLRRRTKYCEKQNLIQKVISLRKLRELFYLKPSVMGTRSAILVAALSMLRVGRELATLLYGALNY